MAENAQGQRAGREAEMSRDSDLPQLTSHARTPRHLPSHTPPPKGIGARKPRRNILEVELQQGFRKVERATVAERLASSIPGRATFRMWESCRTMPLVGGFTRGSPVSPAPSFRRALYKCCTLSLRVSTLSRLARVANGSYWKGKVQRGMGKLMHTRVANGSYWKGKVQRGMGKLMHTRVANGSYWKGNNPKFDYKSVKVQGRDTSGCSSWRHCDISSGGRKLAVTAGRCHERQDDTTRTGSGPRPLVTSALPGPSTTLPHTEVSLTTLPTWSEHYPSLTRRGELDDPSYLARTLTLPHTSR
ncbi:hypothetical protein PR048_007391 [Dryococelus australis]|uniref:Uncharacterized protein n=1 Tax=Dryococelus australis TaxID=614101 RepID=A0ABQ9HU42_9NEOP|nr:hypothetical protein PR048_007391 [Dryococelus australis]